MRRKIFCSVYRALKYFLRFFFFFLEKKMFPYFDQARHWLRRVRHLMLAPPQELSFRQSKLRRSIYFYLALAAAAFLSIMMLGFAIHSPAFLLLFHEKMGNGRGLEVDRKIPREGARSSSFPSLDSKQLSLIGDFHFFFFFFRFPFMFKKKPWKFTNAKLPPSNLLLIEINK